MSNFEHVVKPLLKFMKVELKSELKDNHCLLELDSGMQVNLYGNWHESLIIVANLGELKSAEQKTLLWNLLEENLFFELPHIQISAAAEEKKIIVWTQERLSQLDSSSTIKLFQRFVERAEEVQKMIGIDEAKSLPEKALRSKDVPTRLGTNKPWL